MRRLLFFIIVFLAAKALYADPVTPYRASKVASNFMAMQLGSKSNVELSLRQNGWDYDGIYLFERYGGGWVLVAADDCVKPILGYSTSGSIDPYDMPPALTMWLNNYAHQISAVRNAHALNKATTAYPEDIEDWKRLEKGSADITKDNDNAVVGPLISSRWNQRYPYNLLCPAGTVSGCVATAMAMYMKFWHFPLFGMGSYSYTTVTTGTLESADFGHTIYDWDNMPDSTSQYDTPDEINAIATLMYHCGVSVNMEYGTAASGGSAASGITSMSNNHSIDNAMKDFFHYSSDMRAHFKEDNYTNESWRNLLIDELNQGRPILYCGAAEQGGHAFICDGYDSRQYMHFNFGWSGTGDGYYPVDSISPGVGGVGGNVTYTFNMINSCLTGVVPDYALQVSDTIFNYNYDGGVDSLLVGINVTNSNPLTITSSADWVVVEHDSIGLANWVRLHVDPMTDNGERAAQIVFRQGEETATVKVAQTAYNEEDLCSLMVKMENTNPLYEGWKEGAHLSFESEGGYVFCTARLDSSNLDSVIVRVGPKNVHCVWHSGSGTDRYVNYWIYNQYGEELVSVINAHRNGGTNIIPWSCAHLAVDETTSHKNEIYPNPAHNTINVNADNLQKVEIIDLGGRLVAQSSTKSVDISKLPKGHYFVRIVTSSNTSIKKFVKR